MDTIEIRVNKLLCWLLFRHVIVVVFVENNIQNCMSAKAVVKPFWNVQ